MANVAKALQPDCTVSSGSAHYLVDVTWNGTTKSYGGAGNGNTDPVMSKYIESLFTFDGGANDYAFSSSLDKLERKFINMRNNRPMSYRHTGISCPEMNLRKHCRRQLAEGCC